VPAPCGLALHDVENVTAFCLGIVERKLAANGGYLRADWREELVGELLGEAGILAVRFRPELSSSFRAWAGPLLAHRVDDWYRRKLGDSRAKHRGREVSLEDAGGRLVSASHAGAVELRVTLGR
jgi:hypothetical protein